MYLPDVAGMYFEVGAIGQTYGLQMVANDASYLFDVITCIPIVVCACCHVAGIGTSRSFLGCPATLNMLLPSASSGCPLAKSARCSTVHMLLL